MYLKCRSSQTPANLGGTPVVIENLKSCICNLAGPADIFDLGGQDDIWIKNCWSANANVKMIFINKFHFVFNKLTIVSSRYFVFLHGVYFFFTYIHY